MKKILILLLMFGLTFVSACSSVTDVANTAKYVSETFDYVTDISTFATNAQPLAEQAVNDEAKREEFKQSLLEAKSDIEEFNVLTPPDIFNSSHEDIATLNNDILSVINETLSVIDSGDFSKEFANKFKITEEINGLKNLLENVKSIN